MLEVKNENGKVLEVLFDGYVGDDITVQDVQAIIEKSKYFDSVKLQINSGGGFIFDGYAMINLFAAIKDKLDIEVIGIAASMASVIALSGRSLTMRQGTWLMIHRASSGVMGNAKDMRESAELLERIEADIIKIYESHSALTHDEIVSMMEAETWIDARQALDYGFATAIDESVLPAAASLSDKYKLPNMPAALIKPEAKPEENLTNIVDTETVIKNKKEIQKMDNTELNIDDIVAKATDAVLAKIPAGRKIEDNAEPTNKIDKWFADYLVNRIEPRNATIKTSDGYGVPTLVDSEVFKRRSLGSFVRKEVEGLSPAKVRKYSADTKVVCKVNPTAAIIAEGADYANGSDKGSVVEFDSIKMGSIYSATEEISEESLINVVADFTDDAGRALAKLENAYFLTGSGSGEPQGMITGGTLTTATSGLTTSGFSATAGEAYALLVDFDEKLPAEYADGAFYMCSSTVRAGLRKIVDSNKRPILQEYANGLFSLFGKPVIINDNMDTFGASKKVLLLGNREGYGVGDRTSGLKVRVSENTQNGDTELRWSVRLDGKVLDATAFQVLACPAS